MYITGRSGSGKSTLAKTLSDSKTDTIHLDLYLIEDGGEYPGEKRSERFDALLKKRGIKHPGKDKFHTKEFWDYLEKCEAALDEFGKLEYAKGRKVIAEGVQVIQEGGLQLDKSYYRDKPLIVVGTSNMKSSYRAMKRDNSGAKLFVKNLLSNDSFEKESKELLKDVNVSNGKEWLDNYLKEINK